MRGWESRQKSTSVSLSMGQKGEDGSERRRLWFGLRNQQSLQGVFQTRSINREVPGPLASSPISIPTTLHHWRRAGGSAQMPRWTWSAAARLGQLCRRM